MATPDALKRMIPYQSVLSAADWNAIIDILKALSRRQLANGIVDSTGAYPAPEPGATAGTFLVYLTQNGGGSGDDGTNTTAYFPTYTYDVYTDAAKTNKIGTAVAVLFHRPLTIAVTAATHGLATWNGGTLIQLSAHRRVYV